MIVDHHLSIEKVLNMDSKAFAKRLIDELSDAQTEVLIDFLSGFFKRDELAEMVREMKENGDTQ